MTCRHSEYRAMLSLFVCIVLVLVLVLVASVLILVLVLVSVVLVLVLVLEPTVLETSLFLPLSYLASPLPTFPLEFRGEVNREETKSHEATWW